MRIAGLDVGDRRIGVAISDEMGWTAQGLGVVERSTLAEDLEALCHILSPYQPERIVVGLPRTMSGTLGPQAQKVLRFCKALVRRFQLSVVTWDERFSTVGAERVLLDADVSRRKRRQVIDKVAAVFVLQGYLDSLPEKK